MSLFFKNEVIEFYCHPNLEGVIPEPIPANKAIAKWFKKLSIHGSKPDQYGSPGFTAKKCMPLLDAMSLGFIIPLQADLHIRTNSDLSSIEALNPGELTGNIALKVAEFHNKEQVGMKSDAIKFVNYWVIKTAPGWSTMFVPPINHFNENFTCFSGIVDTDRYPKEINFPAIWHTPDFDAKLPAGTPLVTVIPFKRNTFDSKPKIRKMSTKEFKEIETLNRIQNSRASHYTNDLRDKR